MPRRPRVILPNIPLHVIQRGNNRQACFVAEEDCCFYLDWLKEYAGKTGCSIHAYVLMTNHVHLLLSSATGDGVGALRIIGDRPRLSLDLPYEVTRANMRTHTWHAISACVNESSPRLPESAA